MAKSDPIPNERVLVFRVEPGQATSGALEKLHDYLSAAGAHARLTSLDASDDEPLAHATSAGDMAGAYILRADSKTESYRLEELLNGDPRVRDLYRPPAYRAHRTDRSRAIAPPPIAPPAVAAPLPPEIAKKIAEAAAVTQWGYVRCGFSKAQRDLESTTDFAPVVMIDNGNHLRHPQLASVISRYRSAEAPHQGSVADHSSSVAGIIGARRVEHADAVAIDGCCSAEIEMYNTWTTTDGLDHDVLYRGLTHAIRHRRPVVNMSIWLDDDRVDDKVASLLDECEANGVVVVAAIGNAGLNPVSFFPSTHPTVIAVAATDPGDLRQADSSVGRHAFIGAPGENIYTIVGDTDYDRMTGTSFAAPFVTAAVWLARRHRPDLIPVQVRWLLSQSVEVPGTPRNPEVGFGRLDMQQLVDHIDKVPSPDDCARFLGEPVRAAKVAKV
jgi:hypothetical protein